MYLKTVTTTVYLMKVSDFCRKYKLPAHRFTRYKHRFNLEKVEGYLHPWVKVDDHNLSVVSEILKHQGTRRKKQRLNLEAFCEKYGLTSDHFNRVCHRMQLEDHEGEMVVVDSKHNYALLKHGRLIRKKT